VARVRNRKKDDGLRTNGKTSQNTNLVETQQRITVPKVGKGKSTDVHVIPLFIVLFVIGILILYILSNT